jgi:hypothetical protein
MPLASRGNVQGVVIKGWFFRGWFFKGWIFKGWIFKGWIFLLSYIYGCLPYTNTRN